MLSKSRRLYSIYQLQSRTCLNGCRHDYGNHFSGIKFLGHSAYCSVTEPLRDNDLSSIVESPELPDWVKSSGEDKGVNKTDDDDFVPPSLSYWIENHSSCDQGVDMKSVVNDIIESDVDRISKILKNQYQSSESVTKALDGCLIDLSSSLVKQVLQRFSCEWVPAYGFFRWVESQNKITHPPDVYNLMVDNLGKTKKFGIMWELLGEMRNLEGYVSLYTMAKVMRRLAKAGKYEDAIEAFKRLDQFGVGKDITAFNILVDKLVKGGSIEDAEKVFLEFKDHIPPTDQTYNILAHGWCKIRKLDKAKGIIDEMKRSGFRPSSITYTPFIELYCREKDFRGVDNILEEMKSYDLQPSVVTYTIMMNAYAKAKEIDKAMEIYGNMKQNNCSPDATFYNVFIGLLSKAGRLKDSDAVFEDMSAQGIAPVVSTYNTLIYIAARDVQEEKALSLLLKMERSKCKPDLTTYAPLLKMCCRLGRMKVLSFLLSHMFKNDVSLDLGTYALLVSRLCKNGKLDRACEFFEEMVVKGFVPMDCTYDILVRGLEKKGMHKEKQRIEELMLQAKQQGDQDRSSNRYAKKKNNNDNLVG